MATTIVDALKAAVTTAGGTPTATSTVGLLRQLITTWGGTPQSSTIVGLLREAIALKGGTPTKNTSTELLKQLISTLGGTPVTYLTALYTQLATVAGAGGIILRDLTPLNFSLVENSNSGTLVGAIGNNTVGSTLTLVDDAGGRFAISGGNLVAGATKTDYEAFASHTITIRETFATAVNSPHDTVVNISVTNVAEAVLNALSLSADTVAENAASNTLIGVLTGTTGGATLTLTNDDGGRFTLTGGQLRRTAVGTIDYETATTRSITVRETLVEASNSPRDTVLTVNVTNVLEVTLNALGGTFTLAEDAAAGDVAGALTGKTASSTLSLANDAGGRVALSGTNITRGATALDYETATSHSFTVRETHADGVNSPRDTVMTLLVSDVADTGSTLTAPALTRDGTSGANPMSWTSSYSGAMVWDAATNTGDKVAMRWRVNGGAWVNHTTKPLTSDAIIGGSMAWTEFAATTFAAGSVVEVQEMLLRYTANVQTNSSAWSNTISDTMGAGAPPAPAVTFSNATADLNYEVTLSTDKLTATKGVADEGANARGGSRGTVPGASKGYFELAVAAWAAAAGEIAIGIVPSGAVQSLNASFGIPGLNFAGASLVITKAGTSATLYANVDGNSYSITTALAVGERIACFYDETASSGTATAVSFYVVRANGTRTQVGPTVTLTGTNRPAAGGTYCYGGARYIGDAFKLYGDSDNAPFLASSLPTGAVSYA